MVWNAVGQTIYANTAESCMDLLIRYEGRVLQDMIGGRPSIKIPFSYDIIPKVVLPIG